MPAFAPASVASQSPRTTRAAAQNQASCAVLVISRAPAATLQLISRPLKARLSSRSAAGKKGHAGNYMSTA